jgi:hypothetical protein
VLLGHVLDELLDLTLLRDIAAPGHGTCLPSHLVELILLKSRGHHDRALGAQARDARRPNTCGASHDQRNALIQAPSKVNHSGLSQSSSIA